VSELDVRSTPGPPNSASATLEGQPALPPVGGSRPHSQGALSALAEVAETVILTVIIFLLIRTAVQNFRIDGDSMEPNLHDRQFLLISKLAYRFDEPRRGDIVVFRFPRDPERDFIKRIVGLPGETVEIRRGQVFIDGQPLAEPYNPRLGSYDAPPITLGRDEVYVLGDNRNNSSDSHTWGPLPLANVIGKAIIIYWPPKDWAIIPSYSSAMP
jgi:signal peptidase I